MLPKFGKSLGSSASAATARGLSVIGADVRIVGDIITQGEMQIDGQVDGDITCQRLVVGEGGRITGEVTAETVQVHGALSGKINAISVVIAKSARVIGDITHDSIEIEAGAYMEGHFLHKGGAARPAAAEPVSEAPRKGNGAHPPAANSPAANSSAEHQAAGAA